MKGSPCPGALTRGGWFVIGVVLALAGPAMAQNAVVDSGLFVSVPSPLTSESYTRIKNRVESARAKPERRPATIIFDFTPNDKDASTPDFGPCYDLGSLIAGIRDTTTVAYVHARATGHTVLPILACQQMVVGPTGMLGEVIPPGEPPLTGYKANGYIDVVTQSRPAYVAVARKMFDPTVQLRKGKKGGADFYFDLRERAKLEKEGVQVTDTAPLPAAPDNRLALLTAAQMRDIGLSRRTVDSARDLFEAYGMNPATMRDDPLSGRTPSAFRYVLRGPIDAGSKEAVIRVVEDVIRKKGNILFLQIESAGGDLQAARDLAQKLSEYRNGENGILIVAYIPDKAPDTAAIVALGCSEIVMSKRRDARPGAPADDLSSEAEFGDFEAMFGKSNANNVDFWVTSLHALAESQGYPPLLIDAMIRKDVEIVRVHNKTNRSIRRLMTDAEWQEDKARGVNAEWVLDKSIKSKGQLLKIPATQAEELGLTRFTVDTRDPNELYSKYGIDGGKVRDATPALLDRFANILKMPAVTVLLVIIGFTGLILEMKVPGTTVPGIVAALCFILVFWAHTQFSGQVAVLAGLLFILGLVLILLEVFVLPGFGAAGLTGILFMLAALGLVTFGSGDRLPETASEWGQFGGKMAQYLLGMIGSIVLAFTIARFLPNIPYANRLMLVPPTEKPGAELEPLSLPGAAQAAALLGAVGTAVTVLRPAGSVRFGEEFVDVVTDGGYIPAGARVQVIEVEGTRIVVKEV